MSRLSPQKKVFFISPPAFGHVNPVTGVAHELVKQNVKVIFYGNLAQKEIIEKTGAEFRQYVHPTFDLWERKEIHNEDRDLMSEMLTSMIDYSYALLPQLIHDVENEQPDVIVYDQIFVPAKFLVEIIKKSKRLRKQPKTIMFLPSFAMNKEIMKMAPDMNKFSLKTVFLMMYVFLRLIVFNIYWGILYLNPIKMFLGTSELMNIVAVFPELQPLREQFDHKFKFVGPCISEKVRNFDIEDENLKRLVDMFKPRQTYDDEPNDKFKLVYVSLGTVFNHNITVYEKIIDSFRILDKQCTKINMKQLKVIVSVGDDTYKQMQEKIKNGVYKLPENLMIAPKVPQIEILKRASLYVTHAGQNSISETIQYAVPIVSIPIMGDQHMTTKRMCDDMKTGVHFNAVTFKPDKLSEGIEEVLTNPEYRKNIVKLSQTSRKYNGVETASQFIVNCLNDNTSEKKSN